MGEVISEDNSRSVAATRHRLPPISLTRSQSRTLPVDEGNDAPSTSDGLNAAQTNSDGVAGNNNGRDAAGRFPVLTVNTLSGPVTEGKPPTPQSPVNRLQFHDRAVTTARLALQMAPHALAKKSSREIVTTPSSRASSKRSSFSQQVFRRMSSVLKLAGISIADESNPSSELWKSFDVDGDGIIDFHEFCEFSCKLLEMSKSMTGVARALALSRVESRYIRLLNLEIKRAGSLERAIEKIFNQLDQNRSGRISQVEFEDGIKELGLLTYNFEVHGQRRRYADNSLFLMNAQSRIRYWMVWLIDWKWFDRFILACIVTNSVMLAFKDYTDPGLVAMPDGSTHPSRWNRILDRAETGFSWIFAVECGMKIVAMGFVFGRGSYLRSHWNQLDFVVVLIGIIGDIPNLPKVSSLRTARVLRPLRTLSNLRGMRMLIYALFSAIPALFNVMVILGFVFTVFGILGVLFWNGILHYRCRTTEFPVDGVWELADDGHICGGEYQCPDGQFCGSIYNLPPDVFIDLDKVTSAELWDYKLVSFDNIGYAMLTLFQCITLEGWTSVMYNIQDANNWAFATCYFVCFTIIGAFFLLQFVFAVIWEKFNAANDSTANDWDLILQERRLSSSVALAAVRQNQRLDTPRRQRDRFQKRPSQSYTQKSMSQTPVSGKRPGVIKRLRLRCRDIVSNKYFSWFIVFCILLNTLCLAVDEYPVDPLRTAVVEKFNYVLTAIFFVEMILKLLGFGVREYVSDRFNVFDGAIVCASVIEFVVDVADPGPNASTGLSSMRSFRLFRVMKLARSWGSLRQLLVTISNSIADVANFGMLLLLLMYVFALIGIQLFGNTYRFDNNGDPVEWEPHIYNTTVPLHAPWTPERPYTIRRSNFDDILGAFTTVFQCLTEESWNFVMTDGIRATGWGALIYFLAVMIIGNIVILNLFLAILLGNFSLDEDQAAVANAMVHGQRIIQLADSAPTLLKASTVCPLDGNDLFVEAGDTLVLQQTNGSGDTADVSDIAAMDAKAVDHQSTAKARELEPSNTRNDSREKSAAAAAHQPQSDSDDEDLSTPVGVGTLARNNFVAVYSMDRALYLFSKSNRVRRVCSRVIHSSYFESLMLIVIFASSIQLAIDNPLNDPNSRQSIVLGILDKVFTAIFTVEMVLKVIDVGFLINGRQSYMLDAWNLLDIGILICSWITMFSSNKALRSIRSLRTLRALRPLRMISRVPGMKRVVNALLSSIPSIMNVFLVCILIFLIFGVIAVNLFKGRLYYCDMSSFSDAQNIRLEATYGFTKLSFKKLFSEKNCTDEGGVWSLHDRNYNNVLKSAEVLFEMATTEGWVDIMYAGVDATEIGYHPVQNWNRGYIAFFIIFIIIGNFFTMNLFVGAVIDNFNRMRDNFDNVEISNDTQREWLQIQALLRRTKLTPKRIEPRHAIRRLCFRIQHHRRFEALVAACVLLNTVMLAITHFRQSAAMTEELYRGNIFFWLVFFAEAVIKIVSMGRTYFQNRWNLFDFAVVCGSTVAIILTFTIQNSSISPVANTIRAFRLGLAIRLIKRAKSMQDIVSTIFDNMPALVNVSTLLFLVMFVYGVIGVQLFADVKLGENLDEHANFRSISYAMLALFRFTTGEAWNDVMYDLMVQPVAGSQPYPNGDSCVPNYSYETLVASREFADDHTLTIGCSPGIQITYLYFLSYMLVTSYVLLNLFVAVILEGFEETTEKRTSTITEDDLALLIGIWERYDQEVTGYLHHQDFMKFLRELPQPLGLPKHSSRMALESWVRALKLELENDGQTISFTSFIWAGSHHVMRIVAIERGDSIEPAGRRKMLVNAGTFFSRSQKAVHPLSGRSAAGTSTFATPPFLGSLLAATRIQALARARIARREFAELKSRTAQSTLACENVAGDSGDTLARPPDDGPIVEPAIAADNGEGAAEGPVAEEAKPDCEDAGDIPVPATGAKSVGASAMSGSNAESGGDDTHKDVMSKNERPQPDASQSLFTFSSCFEPATQS